MNFDSVGKFLIHGYYQEILGERNILEFNILSDQSFIPPTLDQLQIITSRYGGLKGIATKI